MIVPDIRMLSPDTGTLCGVDEAGRGALAGPLVSAGVALDRKRLRTVLRSPIPLRDGKTLSPAVRRDVYNRLLDLGIPVTVHTVPVTVINSRGIQFANRTGIRAVIRTASADLFVVDGTIRPGRFRGGTPRVQSVVRADSFVIPVILAGIVAKHVRDSLMLELSGAYPPYLWHRNAGYGTRQHIDAIIRHGSTSQHRPLFVRTALTNRGDMYSKT